MEIYKPNFKQVYKLANEILLTSNTISNFPFSVTKMIAEMTDAEYSNIGINRIEELLKIPNCKFVLYVGKKKLVKRREFDKFLSDTVEI